LDAAHLFAAEEVILSAGGGAFLDLVASALVGWQARAARARVVIRPGSYVSHDDGFYAEIAAFAQPESQYRLRSALEIWGRVLSRPEPRLAFLDFGRRDVSFDQGLPLPQTVRDIHGRAPRPAAGFTLTALNDQHAYLSVPADDLLAVGEWVGCGISHPCTAFDKWRFIPLVDDSYTCVGTVTTRF
jgi:D-serine deaminase-like pyridoxal phosphate-dependent protein